MRRRIEIVSATKEEHQEVTPLYGSLMKLVRIGDISWDDVHFEMSNTKGLAEVYNKWIGNCGKDSVVVFAHDDIIIEDLFFREKIETGIEGTPILGLAGCSGPIRICEPALWHLMSDKRRHVGEVAHFHPSEKAVNYASSPRSTTVFGPSSAPAVFIDGVFMVVDLKAIPETLRFDEKCPSKFHYYDLNFCLDALNKNVGVQVVPIRIVHKSPGLTGVSEDWVEGQNYFIKKALGKIYGNN